jgi:YD repeat-containing protein
MIKKIVLVFALALAVTAVQAQDRPQTRFYDARGNSIGTAAPQGQGTVRYYDARGNSLGTSTTPGGATKFYDAGGRPTGSFRFDGRLPRPAGSGSGR